MGANVFTADGEHIGHGRDCRARQHDPGGSRDSRDLETTDGRTLRFRRVSRPDAAQQRLLHLLRLSLPERLGVDAECSGDSITRPAENSVT
jgi:hypothetical protein